MAKKLIEFVIADDSSDTILVEVEADDDPESGIAPAARPGEVAARAVMTFGEAVDRLRPVAETVIARLRTLAQQPDEIEVEFGVKLSAQAGAVIAAAGTEANCVVRLRWTNDRDGSDQ